MIKDLTEYLNFLTDIGKTVCCDDGAEKSSQIMTPLQQEMLSGYMLMRMPKTCVWEVFSDVAIVDKLTRFMISNSEEDGRAVLEAMKGEAVKYFYKAAQTMLNACVEKNFLDKQESLGLHGKTCPQTGETLWVK